MRHHQAIARLAALAALASAPAQDAIELGTGLHLFVDDTLVERVENLQWVLHEPARREVGIVFDAPWEGPQTGYATVLRDPSGEFRLYYRGGGDETTREVTCLATSADGITWTRPTLGLFEFDGSTANNIVWTGDRPSYDESHNFSPFVDTNPAAAPTERYKAVGFRRREDGGGEPQRMLSVLGSADGIHWRRLTEEPPVGPGAFDSLNVPFWDPNVGRYVCYARLARHGLRSIQRFTSENFLEWSSPEVLEFDPPQTEHYYTNGITLYPRSPGLYLGFPMRFVPSRRRIGAEERAIDGTSDAVLITSHDGLHFDRFFRTAFIRPGLDPANWGSAHGNNTPATGLLETAPGELSIYWIENCATTPRLRRGTLRTDGFASLHAADATGEVVTKPLVLAGRTLVLNCSTSAAGSVRVEVQSASGEPLVGFSLADCLEIYGDEIERPVIWAGGGELASLTVSPVRLRFALRDADLYAFAVR